MSAPPIALALAILGASVQEARVPDPAPPEVARLEPVAAPAALAFDGLSTHAAPRPLAPDAVTTDWPTFLGPRRDGRSDETRLLAEWGASGPRLLWEMERGSGLASPVVQGERVVYTHRVGERAHVECLEATTGRRFWRHSFPCAYRPRYIANDGPRSTPTIAGDAVFVHGVGGELLCLELATGRVRWQRDLAAEFGLSDGFFGVVSSPLAYGDLLIQIVGAPGPTVAAFEQRTGRLRWATPATWGADCASPVIASVRGRERLFVLAGGESRPPTGGLLVLDPQSGAEEHRFPFRSAIVESVNGASPVVGGERVLLTAAYGVGSAALALGEAGGWEPLWTNRHLGIEFSAPILLGDSLFAVDGRPDRAGAVVCLDAASGSERFRADLDWTERTLYNGAERELSFSIGSGSLLAVDGRLLCLGDNGHLLWLEPRDDGLRVLTRAWLFRANQSWTPPVVSRGLLYVCQNEPERFGEERKGRRLLCYDLRAGSAGAGGAAGEDD